jgi:hypothetical protein
MAIAPFIYIYIHDEADSRFCLEEIEAAPISAGKTCRNGQSNGFSTAAQTLSHPLQIAVSVLMYSWSTRAAPSSRRRRAPSSGHWERRVRAKLEATTFG